MDKRFNIEEIPLVNLYVATDKQRRLRLSADIIDMFALNAGNRVALGYDAENRAIAIRQATPSDPTAANIDKRGYISSARFFRKTQLSAESLRYAYTASQDGWLVFIAEEAATKAPATTEPVRRRGRPRRTENA
ncbi:hypothetical protein BBD42_15515 [Paenibacillus sp. BIHB 4019]|uniref:Uncharacterized protein n=1 Tax=Paenibacillus sp. BIHB 4019 TaxID=1870819 RepID=A0A1B2DJ40_9BACL|nr:hypothetical protein [Paenibacillus sp. BIHB 4019]ANY67716.1 hypothetical protein BBD42_15515 [Paenibacillus sp. BIHB 4019]